MLTEQQTDALVNELQTRATSHGWPENIAENSRHWLQRGAVAIHVGPEVVALRTWTGAILRHFRDNNSAEGARRANEEFYGLEGEPVVDDAARLIAQTGDGHDESVLWAERDGQPPRRKCPDHDEPTIGCGFCGLPVIERIGPCGCPSPQAWIGSGVDRHPNHAAITGQINHASWCPGFQGKTAPVRPIEPLHQQAEIVRPKKKLRREVVSLSLDLPTTKP